MPFNFDPKEWGSHFWYILHLITFSYPDEPSFIEQRGYHDFFVNLQYVIPCESCRKNYKDHIQSNPISPFLSSKTNLIKWLTDIHNKTNVQLKKPLLTVEEVIKKYAHPPNYNVVLESCKKCRSSISKYRFCLIFLVMLIIIYFLNKRVNRLDF